MDQLSHDKPRLNSSGQPHGQWGEKQPPQGRGREIGTGMLESWAGQETQGPQGTRKSCWVKHHLPSDRHTLKDLESTGLVASSHPQRKNTNKSEHRAVHRHKLRGALLNHTEMCRHGDPATCPPGTHLHRRAHTHTVDLTMPECLSLPSRSCSPPVS